MSENRKSIPKFGSFKPKPLPLPAASVPIDERKHSSKREDGSESRAREKRSRHRHRSRSRDRDQRLGLEVAVQRSRSPKQIEPSTLFVVDRKGDEKNLIYGSVHRYSVPPFHRSGAGGVLGSDMKIDRECSDDKTVVLSNLRHSNFTREKYAFARVWRERPRLLKIRADVTVDKYVDLDYVPLQESRGRKRKRSGTGDGDSSGSDVDQKDYRSIHGKAKNDNPLDDALQYATESESSDSGRTNELDPSVRRKNVELSRKVELFSDDIEAWLALIEHQDKLMRSEDDPRRATNAEIRSTADIKIHMYEKALEKAKTLSDRERLLLGLMAEGGKIWEIKVQSDRWEQISQSNMDSLLLWKSYLDFKQSNFSTFRYEGIREIFVNRIKALRQAISMAGTNSGEPLYRQLLYIFLRFTLFIRESGYTELAVAMWQGLLEINFWAPVPSPPNQEILKLFQDYWESEVPRIGEDNALGLRHFADNQDAAAVPDPIFDEVDDSLNSTDIFKSWAVAERSRCKGSRVPARTMDEVVENDPFRVILFSDVEEYLVVLPPNAENLRMSLLDAFLLFCRLPPMPAEDEERSRNWSLDAFIRGELLEWDNRWTTNQYPGNSREDIGPTCLCTKGPFSALEIPSPNFASSPESMFGDSRWFRSIEAWSGRYEENGGPVAYSWVRNTLKQLTQVYFREDFAEYHLAFEWWNEPFAIKKTAKALLKQHSASLRLYNAYGMIEFSRQNQEIARGVFSAALSMSRSIPESDQKNIIMLWRNWIWASLEDARTENPCTLSLLLSIMDGTPKSPDSSVDTSPAMLLKARQHLSTNRDYLLSSGDVRPAVMYAECQALLEYLTSNSNSETQSEDQGDIASALSVYTTFSQTLINRNLGYTTSHELLLQSAARLLFHNARIGPFRPALLREHLAKSISLFPQNTIFLSLYSSNESRLRIDDRVRKILYSTVLAAGNDTLASRLFHIRYEMKNTAGSIHSVRSAFENAVSSPVCQSSPGLWKLYLLYCLNTEGLRSRVKEIWYRALRACPWAKELYILGFENLDASQAELKAAWRIMGEKDLRVHVDLEERFEDLLD
jgi:hypothetical protein